MDLNIDIISAKTGGLINQNNALMEQILSDNTLDSLITASTKGTPILKFGRGHPRVMIVAGIHGNELPPQIAAIQLMRELQHNNSSKATIYIIPFAIPFATMENNRRFEGMDMNRRAWEDGSISNLILDKMQILKVNSVADFHSTQKRSNPGVECVFCSKKPCYESLKIAEYITKQTSSKVISQEKAGNLYKGALEDESNIRGVPAVTCEVVSANGVVDSGSPERSLQQMKSYLDYFGIKFY
jgi:predicted deacylase